MNSALWGAAAALAWGLSDFIARYTGRTVGPPRAMLGLMAVGSVVVGGWLWTSGMSVPWQQINLLYLLVASLAALIAPLMLYYSLTFGPMSLAAPIAAAYPALVVPVSLMMGARPDALEWLAMVVTVVGAVVVARNADEDPDETVAADPKNRRRSIITAVAAGSFFAVALLVGKGVAGDLGNAQMLWLGRLIGFATLLAILLVRREKLVQGFPLGMLPLIVIQGVSEASAYLLFFMASHGEGAAIASVTASGFMVVAVLLGWIFLRERISMLCASGILMVFGGVATLAYLGGDV